MFFLEKGLERLDIAVDQVLGLQRSLGDASVALPGFPTQRTTAYLCVYRSGKGVRVAAVLHLKTSGRLAFYLNEEGEVGKRQAQRIHDAAIYFVESMGFMLNDMEIGRLPAEERHALWQALPLAQGAPAPVPETTSVPMTAVPVEDLWGGQGERKMAQGHRPAPPTSNDLEAGRQKILESLGRFLASL